MPMQEGKACVHCSYRVKILTRTQYSINTGTTLAYSETGETGIGNGWQPRFDRDALYVFPHKMHPYTRPLDPEASLKLFGPPRGPLTVLS